MANFTVTLSRQRTLHEEAVIEVEADSVEQAEETACLLADSGQVVWKLEREEGGDKFEVADTE